jgi:hypothetical protein
LSMAEVLPMQASISRADDTAHFDRAL